MDHGIYPNNLKKVQITLDTGDIFTITTGPDPLSEGVQDVIAAIEGTKSGLDIETQQYYRRAKSFEARCGSETFSWNRSTRPC